MTAPVLNASHVRCPGCGAPAGDPLRTTCDYCRAALGAQACPTCHTRMAPGVAYCPWCGTHAITPLRDATPLRCPCGDGTLDVRLLPTTVGASAGEVRLAECGTCHGVWVSRETIERLVTSHADDTLLLALAPGVAATQAPRARSVGVEPVRYRRCPTCDAVMNRVNYARISGIIVDVCREHGTWFDVHELPALLEFVRRGGLDAARAKETEALIEERRRLERERLMRVHTDAPRGGHPLMRTSVSEVRREGVFGLLRALLSSD
ncbi:MAG TPA: zinc ribbon domain-containing protein [Gemmatimonadaceae bacterium]|nr:zinc ribbon domain-containing protein [Gemmatimonadaceae bacterium]